MGVYLGRMISTNKCLKDIDLRWNKLGINGIKVISESISLNETLTSLELIGNNGSEECLGVINKQLDENWKRGILTSHPAYK